MWTFSVACFADPSAGDERLMLGYQNKDFIAIKVINDNPLEAPKIVKGTEAL